MASYGSDLNHGTTIVVSGFLMIVLALAGSTAVYVMFDGVQEQGASVDRTVGDSDIDLAHVECVDRTDKQDFVLLAVYSDENVDMSEASVSLENESSSYRLDDLSGFQDSENPYVVRLNATQFEAGLGLIEGDFFSVGLTVGSSTKQGSCTVTNFEDAKNGGKVAEPDSSTDSSKSSDKEVSNPQKDEGGGESGTSSVSKGGGGKDLEGKAEVNNPPNTVNNYNQDGWQTTYQNVNLECSDVETSCESIEWRLINSSSMVARSGTSPSNSVSINISEDGATTLEYRGIDTEGSKEEWQSQIVKLDLNPPYIYLPDQQNWFNTSIAKSVEESNIGPSGINKCDYRVKDGTESWTNWKSRTCGSVNISVGYDAECEVQGENMCVVEVRVEDNAGKSETHTSDFNVDYSPPTTRIKAPSNSSSFFNDFDVAFNDTDYQSNLTACLYRLKTEDSWRDWQTRSCNQNITVPLNTSDGCQESICIVETKVADSAGNTASSSKSFDVDFSNPQQHYNDEKILPARIQAEDFDLGGQEVAYNDVDSENQGGQYRSTSVDIQYASEGGYNVGWTAKGEWLEYTVESVPTDYDLVARVATEVTQSRMRFYVDDVPVGVINASNTGGWQTWQNTTLENIDIQASGKTTLRVEFIDGGVNLNWIEFVNSTELRGSEIPTGGSTSTHDHYIWLRSANGSPIEFSLKTSEGDISADINASGSGYWVSADRTDAGAETSAQSGLPGLWYKGTITKFNYSGPVEVFIDGNFVAPEDVTSYPPNSNEDNSSVSDGGPSNKDNWNILFEDDFEGSSINTSKWSIGFGWGTTTTGSPEVIRSDQIDVRNGALRLTATHESDGDIYAGAVNTKNKHYYGPGTYWEARIKAPKRQGFLPAFWSKPNTEAWPPEIDFMELFQAEYRGSDAWTNPHYNIHYSNEGCGSGSDNTAPIDYNSGIDVTKDYHVYGAKWLKDKVLFYFDGEKVGEVTDSTALQQLSECGPHYMMLNIHVDRVGTTDKTETWDEEMAVDWVRVWEQDNFTTVDEGGPPDQNNWAINWKDDFEGNSLNESNWGLGWGWGMGSPGSKTTWAKERHVNVENGNLVLTASKEDWQSDGVLYSGNVHTKDKINFKNPVYIEYKADLIRGTGFQNAFWSKPNTEAWPPELDYLETFQAEYRGDKAWTNPHYNMHYSNDDCGSGSDNTDPYDHDTGQDITDGFHIYGAKWTKDKVEWYFDGEKVGEAADPAGLQQLDSCGPHYMMISLNLDNVGTTDKTISWANKKYKVDWVRLWKPK